MMPRQPLTRRNGQPRACELCRKSKIRCDHATPNCGRCVRRGLLCIYHPAPMTKSRDLQSGTPSTSLGASPEETDPSPQSRDESVSSPYPPQNSVTSINDPPSRVSLFLKPPTTYSTTRFSAVFFENQASFDPALLGVAEDGGSSVSRTATSILTKQPSGDEEATINTQVQLGMAVLLGFPTLKTCELLLEQLNSIHDVWVSPTMVRQCLDQVWFEFGYYLSPPRSAENLARMASSICNNSKQRIYMDDKVSWHNWFGGPRLRWEMFSILFCFFGMAFKHFQEWDPVFDLPEQQGRNRNTAANKMKECAAECLKLCENTEFSDIDVCAIKNISKLQSHILSDESDQLRKDGAAVYGAAISTGLHRLPIVEEVTPLSEYRTTLAASTYSLDKSDSLFCGRPPMLTRHYTIFRLPLDLSEDDLYGGPEKLAAARARLDAQGWDTSGLVHTLTWLRACYMLAPIKEQVLELSLGINVQFTKAHTDDLLTRLNEIVASYPPKIQYHNVHARPQKSFGGRTPRELYFVTTIHLDILQSRFLIERLNVSRSFVTGQALLDIAREMMTTVLWFWLNRDLMINYNFAFDWMVVCYGIPAAGVLCVELLRSTKPPYSGESRPHFLRSEVIQSLTMFIGFLDWVRPTDNNYELCVKLNKVIKNIVDSVLDAPHPPTQLPQPPQDQSEAGDGRGGGGLRGNNGGDANNHHQFTHFDPLPISLDGLDDLNWLNTIDWTQGDWLDMNQQPLPQQ